MTAAGNPSRSRGGGCQQPGIAALAAGSVSPIATVVLVAVTLFGAQPVSGCRAALVDLD